MRASCAKVSWATYLGLVHGDDVEPFQAKITNGNIHDWNMDGCHPAFKVLSRLHVPHADVSGDLRALA